MTDTDQLSITTTAFDQWRIDRQKPSELTPLALRQQAVSLSDSYPSSKITAALKISGAQLNQWRTLLSSKNRRPEFVPLPCPNPPAIDTLKIDLAFANGTKISLSGTIPSTWISTIIQEIKP